MIHRRSGSALQVALGCVLAGGYALAAGADDPRAWLEKMNHTLATRNYDGTFFHVSDGQVETMRIVHRVHGGQVTERLMSLDGSGREFIRNNEELTCYLPDQHTVLVEPRPERGPFLSSLPAFGADVNESYRIESLPPGRILGRPAHVIAVTPKDQYRFGYRLWLDDQTAMPLKTQLCDSRGQVIEQVLFAKLEMPESIPEIATLRGGSTAGMRFIRQGRPKDSAAAGLGEFRASRLPPGFRLTQSSAQTLGAANSPASHLVYSDGVATVSVFVESTTAVPAASTDSYRTPAPKPMQGLARVGAGYVFSTVVQGHQITAVGEVPAQTVEYIAHSVIVLHAAPAALH